jgi:hypothetical protein
MVGTEPGLVDEDLPGLFEAADTASSQGQQEYVNFARLRLMFAVFAAATGTFTWLVGHRVDLAAIATAVALAATAAVEVYLQSAKPEELWYDGRALAESAKSLAWRFSVGGLPFEKGDTETATELRFIDQLKKLLAEAPETSVRPSHRPVVSDRMRALRAADLATRKAGYLTGRITDQHDWYARMATKNAKRAKSWRLSLLMIELFGICAALAKAIGWVPIDIAGVVGAIIAAGAAWIGLKQHTTLARAYTFAATELGIVKGRLELVDDEESWSREVADSEEAISREHTMWRASRSRASG